MSRTSGPESNQSARRGTAAGADLPMSGEPDSEEPVPPKPNPWITTLQVFAVLAIVAGSFWLGTQKELVQRFSQWGYVSSFLISLIGSATVILPAPGLALILALGAHLNPVLLGVVAGFGSGLGELSGYLAGRASRNLVSRRGKFSAFLHHMTTRYTAPALFILAIVPLPIFDVAGILAGAMRMPAVQFLSIVISGKIIKHVLAAYLGAEFFEIVLAKFGF